MTYVNATSSLATALSAACSRPIINKQQPAIVINGRPIKTTR